MSTVDIALELADLPHVPVTALEPFQGNLKELTAREYNKLKKSLQENGVIVPFFVWQETGKLLDGHQRQRVFMREGWHVDVPVVYISADDVQDAKRKLLVISSQYGKVTQDGWDEFTFDLDDDWLHDTVQFDALPFVFGDLGDDGEPAESSDAEPQVNRAEELRAEWGVELGQMWRLPSRTAGQEHRLICGDCADYWRSEVESLVWDPEWDTNPMPPGYASALVFTDGYRMRDCVETFGPPSWVFTWDCVSSWYTPNRPLRRAKYCLWYGDIDQYRFDGAHYGDSGNVREVVNTRGSYTFRPDPRGKHLSDVFSAPIAAPHANSEHNHSKPSDWIRMLLGNCTRGEIYDPFCGSGESIIAAENLARQCRAVEISPAYVAVALQRYQDAFGITPELIA